MLQCVTYVPGIKRYLCVRKVTFSKSIDPINTGIYGQ